MDGFWRGHVPPEGDCVGVIIHLEGDVLEIWQDWIGICHREGTK